MKRTFAILAAAFTIAVGTLLAGPDNGQHNGWPNRGHPNSYASPRPHCHP